MFIQFVRVHTLLIRQSGDTESNPGHRFNRCHRFSIFHWNLNSLTAHNYLKVSLLRVYVAVKKCDVVYLSETYLGSSNLKVLDVQMLHECINFEIKIANKTCNFISFYRSPSQSKDEFESFSDNLEFNVDSIAFRNAYLIVALGDFNAQTKGWYPFGKTTYEGTTIDGITSQFGLEQLIHESTHIIGERS